MTGDPLDNVAWSSLHGDHARWAETVGAAARYPTDVAPFAALPDRPDEAAWADLATLVGPDGAAVLFRAAVEVPSGWTRLRSFPGVQLVAGPHVGAPDAEARLLTADDVDEATALVAATRPGPWLPRTIELGRYWGLHHRGALVAMAGERLRPAGHVEVSAVCTADAHRGRGRAARLVRHVVAGIEAEGRTALIQATATNPAVALYRRLGFAPRRDVVVEVLRPPAP